MSRGIEEGIPCRMIQHLPDVPDRPFYIISKLGSPTTPERFIITNRVFGLCYCIKIKRWIFITQYLMEHVYIMGAGNKPGIITIVKSCGCLCWRKILGK